MNYGKTSSKRLNKFSSLMLSATMIASLVPVISTQAEVLAAPENPLPPTPPEYDIMLGTGKMASPLGPGDDYSSPWIGSYVYYGKYEGLPMKFRVLDPDADAYGGDSVLLDCDNALYTDTFNPSPTPVTPNPDFVPNDYQTSKVRENLLGDGFLNKAGVFTDLERDSLLETTISEAPDYQRAAGDYFTTYYPEYEPINGDKVFLLDAFEISCDELGYYNDQFHKEDGQSYWDNPIASRQKTGLMDHPFWLTRSAYSKEGDNNIDTIMYVDSFGIAWNTPYQYDYVVSPAMNVKSESILFSDLVEGTLGQLGGTYKFTLIDPNYKIEIQPDYQVTWNHKDNFVYVPYLKSGSDTAEPYVFITDKAYNEEGAEIYFYQEIDKETRGFYLPDHLASAVWGRDYHVYIINQDVYADKYTTNISSKPLELNAVDLKPSVTAEPTPDVTKVATPTTKTATPTPTKSPAEQIGDVVKGGAEAIISAIPTVTPTKSPLANVADEIFEEGKALLSVTPTSTPAPTSTATPTPTDEPTPTPTVDPDLIRQFVDRLYTRVLGREPEQGGADFWYDQLYTFEKNGAEAAMNFVFSDEFVNRNTSDEEFVTILYNTFFDREPEQEGFDFWVNGLKNGELDRTSVAVGFIYSQEWADTCARYGIRSGGNLFPQVQIEPGEKIIDFVKRLYVTALGREAEEGGLNYWSSELANFKTSAEQVGRDFFLSPEMEDQKLSDTEFVTRLYKTFVDREPDEGGLDFWVRYLGEGNSRESAVLGFTRSGEFNKLCIEARVFPY